MPVAEVNFENTGDTVRAWMPFLFLTNGVGREIPYGEGANEHDALQNLKHRVTQGLSENECVLSLCFIRTANPGNTKNAYYSFEEGVGLYIKYIGSPSDHPMPVKLDTLTAPEEESPDPDDLPHEEADPAPPQAAI